MEPQEGVQLSPAAVAGGCCRVQLFHAAPSVCSMLIDALVERSAAPLGSKPDKALLETFARLAWLQEWCRMNRVSVLELVPDASGATTVELQLESLINVRKECFVCQSPQFFVACARCAVACWCSEKCLRAGYDEHQPYCFKASQCRDFFGL